MKFRDEHEDGVQKIVNLHEGHRTRLRERLNQSSFTQIEDYQILEYILTLTIKRKDTNEIAHRLINTFGSLCNVMDAGVEDLCSVKGITQTIAFFLHSIPYIFREYKISKLKPKATLACPQDVFNYLGQCIYHLPQEEFYLLCLDPSNRLISQKIIASGSKVAVGINVKDIVSYVNKVNASKVIMLHNHPNGDCLPSIEDIETTKRLYMGFKVAGIALTDHVIVDSKEGYYSFAHEGVLSKFEEDCQKLFVV